MTTKIGKDIFTTQLHKSSFEEANILHSEYQAMKQYSWNNIHIQSL